MIVFSTAANCPCYSLHVTVNFKDSHDLRDGHQSYQWNQCKRDMDGLKHIEPLV